MASYDCIGGHSGGHLLFDRRALDNSRRRGTTPTCKNCTAQINRALKVLRQQDSWRCTCKKIPAGKKGHAALYEKIHQQKCPLTPMYAGEDRWDGKNNGVQKQDIILLARSNRY